MHRTRRSRGGSLALRLLAVVIVPSLAFGYLAFQRVEDQGAIADEARHITEHVRIQETVAAIYAPAARQRLGLEGTARLDMIGVPREVVIDMTGIDFGAIVSSSQATLDARIAELDARLETLGHHDAEALCERLRIVSQALTNMRARSDQRALLPQEVGNVFFELRSILAETLRSIRGGTPLSGLGAEREQLEALGLLLVSGGDYTGALLKTVMNGLTGEASTSIERAWEHHSIRVADFTEELSPEQLRAFEAVQAKMPLLTVEERAELPIGPTEAVDATLVAAAVEIVLEQLGYLDALEQYSQEFHAQVVAESNERVANATSAVTHTEWLLAAITAFTALAIVVIAASTLRPLRRLTRRARQIGDGQLVLPELPLRGPTDVRTLTATMNEMLGTLQRVDESLVKLAAGDLDQHDKRDMPDIPGAVGVSVRESVHRLASVTAELQRSEQMATAVIDQAADAIWTIEPSGTIRTANEASTELTGLAEHQQIGLHIQTFLPTLTGETTITSASGVVAHLLVAHSHLRTNHEALVTVIARDISERARLQERLAFQARHDALTRLPNRFAVLEHLEQVARNSSAVGVLFVDLDGFKNVNDSRGHATGDRVLTEIAERLARTLRSGEFVGRLGGDEFVVVTTQFSSVDDLVAISRRLIAEVELPISDGDRWFALSASVGVAVSERGLPSTEVLRHADNAVYQAKRRGRGRVELYDASLQASIEHTAEIELALREAILDDQLALHLQPIVGLDTGRVVAVEALLRWNRPGHGMVPPSEFIPVAERSSLIIDLQRWVLERTCSLLADWQRRGLSDGVRIAINISGHHLIDGDLLSDVDAALARSGADPCRLELELTETQLLEDLDRATRVLEALRTRGITIAVDDFGTGYSSMTYLRHLPIDTIKIDQTFVQRATQDGYDSTVIEALLTIGRTLQVSVVAEGVETSDQLDYVKARGCDRAQGYLLARPMPIDAAERLLSKGAAAALVEQPAH